MTSFVHVNNSTQRFVEARSKRVAEGRGGFAVPARRAIAGVTAVVRLWADVRSELANISRSPSLGARSQRLMRSYY